MGSAKGPSRVPVPVARWRFRHVAGRPPGVRRDGDQGRYRRPKDGHGTGQGESPEELRADVERTRQALEDTVEPLASRPRRGRPPPQRTRARRRGAVRSRAERCWPPGWRPFWFAAAPGTCLCPPSGSGSRRPRYGRPLAASGAACGRHHDRRQRSALPRSGRPASGPARTRRHHGRALGAFLLAYAAAVWAISMQARPRRVAVVTVVEANSLWTR
ncbi:DUF3618 domain-containing protein [Actinomadura nitritigenes]|uniref:DUF3618 domain-containing protein n=1 Tax=Actinomadura nitritigenes TaxID=134602 RepID=UPI003D931254